MGSTPDPKSLPFWQVNIAAKDRENECPKYLQGLSEKDIGIIGTRDEDYSAQSWGEVVDIVRSGRLQDFGRRPTDLRRYRHFIWDMKHKWGSVIEYLLREKLLWEESLVPQGSRPFECPEDFKILSNDWPYGIDRRIVHLVVWTKFDLAHNAETEAGIQSFIQRTFIVISLCGSSTHQLSNRSMR